MSQSLATVFIPFAGKNAAAVNAQLDVWGNPANAPVSAAIKRVGGVHFMSVTVIDDPDPTRDAYIVVELSSDGDVKSTLDKLGSNLAPQFKELFGAAGVAPDKSIGSFLVSYHRSIGQGWFARAVGLPFSGCPTMSLERIEREAELARWIGNQTEILSNHWSPLQKLDEVRARLWARGDSKWAFFAEPMPWLDWQPGSWFGLIIRSAIPVIAKLFWPVLILFASSLGYLTWGVGRFLLTHFLHAEPSGRAWTLAVLGAALALVIGMLLLTLLSAVLAAPAILAVRAKERTDAPDDTAPDPDDVGAVMARENFCAQNLLATKSEMKPGILRGLALRVSFATIGQLSGVLYQPGFLGDIGVIHFARWAVVRDRKGARLLFWSNYDGSLESYLEDFIERAHEGVSAIWSNTIGFPRTRWLFMDGARDGDRLRRFVLRAQYPVHFWYSAYRHLTLARIRTNALIRLGIATARTDEEAANWLACFGSAPSGFSGGSPLLQAKDSLFRRIESKYGQKPVPRVPLEYANIPTFAFGGRPHLRYATVLLFQLSGTDITNRAWLERIERLATYGTMPVRRALGVALTASALQKIGLPRADQATFPPAFSNGMTAPWRARALGDLSMNAPLRWAWNGPRSQVDVALLLCADTAGCLAGLERKVTALSDDTAAVLIKSLPMQPLQAPNPGHSPRMREPFGFTDGISQPVIPGTPRGAKPHHASQMIEPGEIILGYRDNLGYLPSTPTVAAASDPRCMLPCTRSPEASHDLGRNGTFLVIRQLRQDKAAFDDWMAAAAGECLGGRTGLGAIALPPLGSLLQAKTVGRWPSGSALPLYPNAAGAGRGNVFLYSDKDPQGHACPLGAHIRRGNPRDSLGSDAETQLAVTNRHRILRIGRPYDHSADDEGLVFMCVNADIGRQFEFVQQTWLLGGSFHGLERETDPIVGGPTYFTIPTQQGPVRLNGPVRPLTTVRGGGYFFLPSRAALCYLAIGGWINAAPATAGPNGTSPP